MSGMWLSDTQKLGVAFCSGGAFFFMAGIVMFFDRAMLAMGNILCILGIAVLLGLQKTFVFFARRQKWKGTAAFTTGIILILFRWAFVGFLIELYGIFVLFGDFLATIAGFVGNIPFVGPYIAGFLDSLSSGRKNKELPV